MKTKILIIMFLLVGCSSDKGYRHFYGRLSQEKMDSLKREGGYIMDEDSCYYKVHLIDSVLTIYYCPTNQKYISCAPDNNTSEFEPTSWVKDSLEYMDLMKFKYGDKITFKETFNKQ